MLGCYEEFNVTTTYQAFMWELVTVTNIITFPCYKVYYGKKKLTNAHIFKSEHKINL